MDDVDELEREVAMVVGAEEQSLPGSPPDILPTLGGGGRSIYTGPSDEAHTSIADYVTDAELRDPDHLDSFTQIPSGDPFIFVDGEVPIPWWVMFPEFLDQY